MQKGYKSNRGITFTPNVQKKAQMPETKLDLHFNEKLFQLTEDLSERTAKGKQADSVVRFGGFKGAALRLVRRKAVWGTAAAVLALSVSLSFCLTNYALAYEVVVDGQTVGVVSAKEAFLETYATVSNQLSQYEETQDTLLPEPEYALVIVPVSETTPEEEIKQNLLSTVDTVVSSYVVTYGGKPLLGMDSKEQCEAALALLKSHYGIAEGEEASFGQPLEIAESAVPVTLHAATPEEALTFLLATESKELSHTVAAGEVFSTIAEQYGMTVEQLHDLNPEVNVDQIKEGMVLKMNCPEPIVKVSVTREEQLEQEIPFEVETVNDDTMLKGTQKTVQEGVAGKAMVTVNAVYENGNRVSETVIREERLAEPVKQIVKVGTKEPPKTVATGSFVRPVSGTISSSFGSRWGRRHNGIDIAASNGTPIQAADGGKVTYAGWMSGYGNLVIIDHENGYCTYYGHMSAISVSAGQRVAQGDLVGKVGSTGNSTGPHLHFEVRKNNTPQNPRNYIG